MNLTIFCNISRLLIRNLNVLKLHQDPIAKSVYKIKLPATATWSAGYTVAAQHNDNENGEREGGQERSRNAAGCAIVSAAFSFNLFGRSEKDDEETPEDKLIKTIKRSILCIQREQYEKAEQMLHLSLRMAQDMQSKDGITYVYDIMANLAMEREQFKKAEKLFADVMKRLLADGSAEDSPQVLHISSKLAHMAQLQGDLTKAQQGFIWTLQKIENSLKRVPSDKQLQELFGLTKNWYGQLLMKLGKYAEAKKSFREAFDCLTDIYGRVNQEAVTILNNLSVACVDVSKLHSIMLYNKIDITALDEFDEAKKYLHEALKLVNELKDTTQEGILHANLGLIYLREGLIAQAKEACSLAYRIGKQNKNADAIEQAEYCLEEIKTFIH